MHYTVHKTASVWPPSQFPEIICENSQTLCFSTGPSSIHETHTANKTSYRLPPPPPPSLARCSFPRHSNARRPQPVREGSSRMTMTILPTATLALQMNPIPMLPCAPTRIRRSAREPPWRLLPRPAHLEQRRCSTLILSPRSTFPTLRVSRRGPPPWESLAKWSHPLRRRHPQETQGLERGEWLLQRTRSPVWG